MTSLEYVLLSALVNAAILADQESPGPSYLRDLRWEIGGYLWRYETAH